MKLLVTGANGSLGRRFVDELGGKHKITTVVRSEAAARRLQGLPAKCVVLDLDDHDALVEVASECELAVNFIGIIRASADNSYYQAHEMTAQAIVRAAEAVAMKGMISLSISGADSESRNSCLRSRSEADQIFLQSRVPATLIRLPMVLGERDAASQALLKKAASAIHFSFRAGSLEQPIYAGDVITALDRLLNQPIQPRVLDLGGPECLPRHQLIRLAGSYLEVKPIIQTLPLFLGLLAAGLLQHLMSSPPVTRTMLELLDQDDDIDNREALHYLNIELTPLADMLSYLAEDFRQLQYS